MIHPHVIQADLIADMLATANITDLLFDDTEVREDQYQGADFRYSTIRLAIIGQNYILGPEPCDLANITFAIRAYTEGSSSKNNSILLGAINDRYHRRHFQATDWQIWLNSAGLINPERIGAQLWRGEALFDGTVYPTSGAV